MNPFYSGLIDEKYRDFSTKIVKDDTLPVLGVRIPDIRKLAKKLESMDFPILCHEDVLLKGLMIASRKTTFSDKSAMLDELLPCLSAWDHSDIIGSALKIMKGDEEDAFRYFSSLLKSEMIYAKRIGIVYLFTHRTLYRDKDILSLITAADSDEYYISMAIAWAIQVFWKEDSSVIERIRVSDRTRKRAEQKIRDSIRERRSH